jgi:hypothetical protein
MIKNLTLVLCLGVACVGTAFASNPGMDQSSDQVTSLRRNITQYNPQLENYCQDMLSKGSTKAEIDKMLYTEGYHLSSMRGQILGFEKNLFNLLYGRIIENNDTLKSGVNAVIGRINQVSRNELNEIRNNYYFCYYATTAGLKELKIADDKKRVAIFNLDVYEFSSEQIREMKELADESLLCQKMLGDDFADLRKLYDLIHLRDQQLVTQQVRDESIRQAENASAQMREQAEMARRQQEEVTAKVNEVVQGIRSEQKTVRESIKDLDQVQKNAVKAWAEQADQGTDCSLFSIAGRIISYFHFEEQPAEMLYYSMAPKIEVIGIKPATNQDKAKHSDNNDHELIRYN